MNNNTRGYIAVGLWVLATVLMVRGTFDYDTHGTTSGFAWGLFIGLGAFQVTTWDLMDRHRRSDVSVEEVAGVVDAMHEAKQALARLH